MKRTILFLFLSLIVLVSCSGSGDVDKDCTYMPVVRDSIGLLKPNTHVSIKNADFPKGVVPVVVTVDTIAPMDVASYADEVFDDLCDNSTDRNAFKRSGLLMVVSRSPQLIQMRAGRSIRTYLQMKEVISGSKYAKLQQGIAEKGLDESCPLFFNECVTEIDNYRKLPWYNKVRIVSAVTSVENTICDLATPSESFFNQIYFRPFLWIVSFLHGIIDSWFLSFLTVVSLLYLLSLWIQNKVELRLLSFFASSTTTTAVDAEYARILSDCLGFVIKLFVSFPTLAAITVFANARTEDLLVLQAAHIPFVEITSWTANDTIVPSLGLLMILVLLYYTKCLIDRRDTGRIQIAFLQASEQRYLLKSPKMSQIFHNIMVSFSKHSFKYFSTVASGALGGVEDDTNNPGDYDLGSINTENVPAKTIHLPIYISEKSAKFQERPCSVILENTHRKALLESFVLFIVASLLPVPVVLYLIAMTISSLAARIWKEYRWRMLPNNANIRKLPTMPLIEQIKSWWPAALVWLGFMIAIYVFTNPFAKVVEETKIKTEYIDISMLEGRYFVLSLPGITAKDGATAKIVRIAKSHYKMRVYSSAPIREYDLQIDETTLSVDSSDLGHGSIEFVKEINKVTIRFEKKWEITK